MKKLLIIIGVFFFPSYSCFSQSNTLKVIIGPVANLTGLDPISASSQPGTIFTKEIVKRLRHQGYSIDYEFIDAWKRANNLFNNGHVHVLFPEVIGDRTQQGITGMPITRIPGYAIYTLTTQPKLHSFTSLEGKEVGLLFGRYYPEELKNNQKIIFNEVNKLEQNFKKLQQGRIDAVIEVISEGNRSLKKLGLTEVHHGNELHAAYTAYRFHPSQQSLELMEAFNTVVADMIIDGTYTEIFQMNSNAFYHSSQ
ncbi:transporter substrate-binding domain-containing protein [Vibrio sp. Of7-15]|uniref:substrate-binding periplasmic protein n=1 Tax=Vibrio sp. Of7-15 TaxID=2724879 RepID=UPI001EF1F11C|nr:transporter substrate-binding domain-containing protein [Vibrio sp. Of7-15]MCG7495476.1 transporter substrate-binding domain-containing protein [Vibrio sp. Of7-15]